MADENTPEETEEVTKEETPTEETPAGDKPAEEVTEETEETVEKTGDEEGDKPEDSKLSHDDALKALTKTRSENANWRTKYRDLEKRLEEAKTPEEIEAIKAEVRQENVTDNHALVVENVALKHKLTDDLIEVLTAASAGKSREELEKHAKTLSKYMPQAGDEEEPGELSGGLDPRDDDESFDPVKASRAARNRARNGGTATYR